MAERLLDRLESYVHSCIDEVDLGDGLQWDLAIFLHPQHGTMVYSCFAIPGAVLGTYVTRGTALINPWGLNSETLKDVFVQNMRSLQEDRSRQLEDAAPPAPKLSGIFLPGG